MIVRKLSVCLITIKLCYHLVLPKNTGCTMEIAMICKFLKHSQLGTVNHTVWICLSNPNDCFKLCYRCTIIFWTDEATTYRWNWLFLTGETMLWCWDIALEDLSVCYNVSLLCFRLVNHWYWTKFLLFMTSTKK